MTKTTAKWGNMPKPDDRAYWLRVFAGQAMQGLLSNENTLRNFEQFSKTNERGVTGIVAESSMVYAIAMLDAIEAHDKEAGNAE